MRAPLTLAVAQPSCAAYDLAENARRHAAAVRRAEARVVVFPELSLTGYHGDAPTVALDDPQLGVLVEACGEARSIALVGAPLSGDGDQVHIAMLAVDGGGASVAYRKLCIHESEAPRFSAGPCPCVLTVDGWRLGFGICKDIWSDEQVASTAALGIDVYLAGVLNREEHAVFHDARARRIARDHGVWVAFASFAGPTGEGYERPAGRSAIWNADGGVLAQAGSEPDAVVRATLG